MYSINIYNVFSHYCLLFDLCVSLILVWCGGCSSMQNAQHKYSSKNEKKNNGEPNRERAEPTQLARILTQKKKKKKKDKYYNYVCAVHIITHKKKKRVYNRNRILYSIQLKNVLACLLARAHNSVWLA